MTKAEAIAERAFMNEPGEFEYNVILAALHEYGAEVRRRDAEVSRAAGEEYSRNAGNMYARQSGRAAASRIVAAIEQNPLP